MKELTLKSQRFRQERELEWRKLEDILARAEASSAAKLSDEEIIALPVLYRSALSSLSVARAISLDQSLIAYLESLCTRAYFFVYGTRTTLLKRILAFFAQDWRFETAIAVALTVLGAAVAYVLTMQDTTWFYSFVSPGLADGRGPTASTEELRSTLFATDQSGLSIFATYLFTHNAQVALLAFALGFAFCVPAG